MSLRLLQRLGIKINNTIGRFKTLLFSLFSRLIPLAKIALNDFAKPWRRVIKWTHILFGLVVFCVLQLLLAFSINQSLWYYYVAAFLSIAILSFAIRKTTHAFVFWLATSPVLGLFLKLDWGSGLPAISYDRLFIYPIAIIILVRAFANRHPMARLLPMEIMLILFPIYLLFMLPFSQHASTPSYLLLILQRIGDVIVLYFITKACIVEKKHAKWILNAILIIGLYSALMAFYDHYTGTQSILALAGVSATLGWHDVGTGRAAGPFKNPLWLGGVLSMCIFVVIHKCNFIKSISIKWLHYVIIAIMIVALYWTFGRGAYLAFVAGLITLPFVARDARRQYLRILAMAGAVGIVLVPILLTNPAVRNRMESIKPIKDRIVTNATLVNMIRHNPLLGVGLGNDTSELPRYVTGSKTVPGLLLWQTDYYNFSNKLAWHTASHNTFLSFFADNGLIGGSIYLMPYLLSAILLLNYRRRNKGKGFLGCDLSAVTLACLISNLIINNTLFTEGNVFTNYIYWVLVATLVKLSRLHMEETGIENSSSISKAVVGQGLPVN